MMKLPRTDYYCVKRDGLSGEERKKRVTRMPVNWQVCRRCDTRFKRNKMTKKNDKVEATGKTEKKATTQPKTQKAKAGAKTVEKEKAVAKQAVPEKTKKVKEQPKAEPKNNTPPKKVKSVKSAQEQPAAQNL